MSSTVAITLIGDILCEMVKLFPFNLFSLKCIEKNAAENYIHFLPPSFSVDKLKKKKRIGALPENFLFPSRRHFSSESFIAQHT